MDVCCFALLRTGGRFIGVPKNKWERQRLARGRGPYRRDRQRTDRQASVQVQPDWKVRCRSCVDRDVMMFSARPPLTHLLRLVFLSFSLLCSRVVYDLFEKNG